MLPIVPKGGCAALSSPLTWAPSPIVWPGGTLPVDSPLIGRYNLSNLLAAVATAWALGRDPTAFLPRLQGGGGVPGRMERIEEGQPFNVLVDSAHPFGYETVLPESMK